MHENGEVKSGTDNGHSVSAQASLNGANALIGNDDAENGGTGALRVDAGRPHLRGQLRTFSRAFDQGWIKPWEIKPQVMRDLARDVELIKDAAMAKGDLRSAVNASDLLRKMAADNVALADRLDKAERLDAGQSTENVRQEVTVVAIEPDRRG